jgi:hypothetical protein
VNHYANFHFLRGVDNLNKLDKPPDEWFRRPGSNVPSYSEADLQERLLTWDDLVPGHFETMIEQRGEKMRKKAEQFFGMTEAEFDAHFADKQVEQQQAGKRPETPWRQTVTRAHIEEALDCIDRDGVPPGREAKDFDLMTRGSRYPPKYVVGLAGGSATGVKEIPWSEFSGGDADANRILSEHGYTIEKRTADQTL